MKIMAIVDRHGLPLAASTHARILHDRGKPTNLIADRAYDSDPLDEELRQDGIKMIAPHRTNRMRANAEPTGAT